MTVAGTLTKVMSGGQTGVDRAALGAANAIGLDYGGWVPREGWAEDHPDPPGVLAEFPRLTAVPASAPAVRTERNVASSTATLVVLVRPADLARSPGTRFTLEVARRLGKPVSCVALAEPGSLAQATAFLAALPPPVTLNVAGPRESEVPGIAGAARPWLERLLARAARVDRAGDEPSPQR